MPLFITSHKVENYEKWRAIFDADAQVRADAGVKNVRVCRSAEDMNEIYVLFDADNPEAVKEEMSTPDMQEKMQAAGVLSEPTMKLLIDTDMVPA